MASTIRIFIRHQWLELFDASHKRIKRYPIASARNGAGQVEGSECTPLGEHKIVEKIGNKAPENAIFVGRQHTGEIYTEAFAKTQPERDWILTRILWLTGLEPGFNLGQRVDGIVCDTKQRYIYIHGCPDSHAMQIPSSHGCIKMRNADMIELFDNVSVGDTVSIVI